MRYLPLSHTNGADIYVIISHTSTAVIQNWVSARADSLCGLRHHHHVVAVWRSGSGGGRIKKVNLCRARLVLGWVTVFGLANHLGM